MILKGSFRSPRFPTAECQYRVDAPPSFPTYDACGPTVIDSCVERRRWPDRLQSDQRFQERFGPGEVLSPYIALWMKERNVLPGHWVMGHRAVCFESVARRTGQTEVLKDRLAARRSRYNMLKLEGDNCQLLCRATIRAAVCELSTDLALKIDRDIGAHVPVTPACCCRKVNLARVFTRVS